MILLHVYFAVIITIVINYHYSVLSSFFISLFISFCFCFLFIYLYYYYYHYYYYCQRYKIPLVSIIYWCYCDSKMFDFMFRICVFLSDFQVDFIYPFNERGRILKSIIFMPNRRKKKSLYNLTICKVILSKTIYKFGRNHEPFFYYMH